MSGHEQQRHQQQGHGGHQLSPVREQTCVLGEFERDQLPKLSEVLQLEFALLNEHDRYNQTTMTTWSYYAHWKDLWLKEWPSDTLDGNKTWDRLVAEESHFRYEFEQSDYPALHRGAKDGYSGIYEAKKRDPRFGPVLRSYIVAYNNFLMCSTTQPEPEPAWVPAQSSQAYAQGQHQGYQHGSRDVEEAAVPPMSERVRLVYRRPQ